VHGLLSGQLGHVGGTAPRHRSLRWSAPGRRWTAPPSCRPGSGLPLGAAMVGTRVAVVRTVPPVLGDTASSVPPSRATAATAAAVLPASASRVGLVEAGMGAHVVISSQSSSSRSSGASCRSRASARRSGCPRSSASSRARRPRPARPGPPGSAAPVRPAAAGRAGAAPAAGSAGPPRRRRRRRRTAPAAPVPAARGSCAAATTSVGLSSAP
jgi:hypothetical protein